MRNAVLVLALLGLNACSNAIVGASFNSTAAVAAPASAGTVTVVSTGGAAAVAGALAFAALMDADYRNSMEMHSSRSFAGPSGWSWGRPAPELDPGRKITEQDCTKPLDLSRGNIRCK